MVGRSVQLAVVGIIIGLTSMFFGVLILEWTRIDPVLPTLPQRVREHFEATGKLICYVGLVPFLPSAFVLWFFAFRRYFDGFDQRGAFINAFLLLMVVGWGWMAGLWLYWRDRRDSAKKVCKGRSERNLGTRMRD